MERYNARDINNRDSMQTNGFPVTTRMESAPLCIRKNCHADVALKWCMFCFINIFFEQFLYKECSCYIATHCQLS